MKLILKRKMTQNMIYNSINHNIVFLPPPFTFLIYIRRRAFSFVPAITICMYTRHVKNISDWLLTTICMEYGPHFKITQENRKIILKFYSIRKNFSKKFPLDFISKNKRSIQYVFLLHQMCIYLFHQSFVKYSIRYIYITFIHILALSKEWQPTQILQRI